MRLHAVRRFALVVRDVLRRQFQFQRRKNLCSNTVLEIENLRHLAVIAFGPQVWAWAMLYRLIGAVGSTEEALYFSTTTFTTLGFGDITLDDQWRLLSSFEGANGLLMFGWSTALIFAAVQKVYGYERRFSKDDSN